MEAITLVGRVDNLIEEVKPISRRNEPKRIEDIVEEILHRNAQAKVQPTQLGQDASWYNNEQLLEERKLKEACLQTLEETNKK